MHLKLDQVVYFSKNKQPRRFGAWIALLFASAPFLFGQTPIPNLNLPPDPNVYDTTPKGPHSLAPTESLRVRPISESDFRVEPAGAANDSAQVPSPPVNGTYFPDVHGKAQIYSEDGGSQDVSANYPLGPGDQVSLIVSDLDEFNDETFRVDMHGDVNLPLIGRFHAAGLTINQLEAETRGRLRKFVKDPDVVANISEYHSQPVSVLGAVNNPGVHQVQGHKTLFEVLSLAGGLRADAGSSIRLTRDLRLGRIPLRNAKDDSTGHFSTASVHVKGIMDGTDPSENVPVLAGDVISVPKAQVVYAVGSLIRPGGFLLEEHETMSSLQVLSLAEGLDKIAAASKARILRTVPGSSSRTEIAVNLKQLLDGKAPDIPLQPDDILFVPSSRSKVVGRKALDTAVSLATGIAIYGRY